VASRTERMVDRLKDLQAGTPGIEASAVMSADGLVLASSLPPEVEEDRVSAMSAAMLALADRLAGEFRRGKVDQVFIRGSEGCVVLMPVGGDAALTVLVRNDAGLSTILQVMKQAAQDLSLLS
jgi:predicted regulator of Ras-like GTPase activity (Roadblock/LC7/MglB family)